MDDEKYLGKIPNLLNEHEDSQSTSPVQETDDGFKIVTERDGQRKKLFDTQKDFETENEVKTTLDNHSIPPILRKKEFDQGFGPGAQKDK